MHRKKKTQQMYGWSRFLQVRNAGSVDVAKAAVSKHYKFEKQKLASIKFSLRMVIFRK